MPIKINSTGGGSVTLDPINTGTAFTISLPAETGTVFTTTSNLTSTTFTGRLPFANLPTGSVLQVVQANTTTAMSSTAGSFVDTNLSGIITPKYATSNILVMINQQCYYNHSSSTGFGMNVLRGASTVYSSVCDNNGPYDWFGPVQLYTRYQISFIDSPASTSALTYKTQIRPYTAGATVGAQNAANVTPGKSYIILMEIAG
jgi:hypothetical protein